MACLSVIFVSLIILPLCSNQTQNSSRVILTFARTFKANLSSLFLNISLEYDTRGLILFSIRYVSSVASELNINQRPTWSELLRINGTLYNLL